MLATHTCAAGGSRRARGVAHDRPNGRGGRLASDARRGGGRQPDSRGPGCSRSRRRSPAAGEGTRAGNTERGWWGGATPPETVKNMLAIAGDLGPMDGQPRRCARAGWIGAWSRSSA